MELKDQHEEDLFYCIKLGLICERCRKNGTACKHKMHMAPSWKPPERTAKVDAMYVVPKS